MQKRSARASVLKRAKICLKEPVLSFHVFVTTSYNHYLTTRITKIPHCAAEFKLLKTISRKLNIHVLEYQLTSVLNYLQSFQFSARAKNDCEHNFFFSPNYRAMHSERTEVVARKFRLSRYYERYTPVLQQLLACCCWSACARARASAY